MRKPVHKNMRLMSANSRDMREFIGVRTEEPKERKKPYYEVRARIIVHKGHIDVTAITDMRNQLPVFPVKIYVVSHNHSDYVHERIWHLYNGKYKIARITGNRTYVKVIEVMNGEARVLEEYTTD